MQHLLLQFAKADLGWWPSDATFQIQNLSTLLKQELELSFFCFGAKVHLLYASTLAPNVARHGETVLSSGTSFTVVEIDATSCTTFAPFNICYLTMQHWLCSKFCIQLLQHLARALCVYSRMVSTRISSVISGK